MVLPIISFDISSEWLPEVAVVTTSSHGQYPDYIADPAPSRTAIYAPRPNYSAYTIYLQSVTKLHTQPSNTKNTTRYITLHMPKFSIKFLLCSSAIQVTSLLSVNSSKCTGWECSPDLTWRTARAARHNALAVFGIKTSWSLIKSNTVCGIISNWSRSRLASGFKQLREVNRETRDDFLRSPGSSAIPKTNQSIVLFTLNKLKSYR